VGRKYKNPPLRPKKTRIAYRKKTKTITKPLSDEKPSLLCYIMTGKLNKAPGAAKKQEKKTINRSENRFN
jgi:hypothetical protein